jgi:FHA domain
VVLARGNGAAPVAPAQGTTRRAPEAANTDVGHDSKDVPQTMPSCQVRLGHPGTGQVVSCSVMDAPDPGRPAAAAWPVLQTEAGTRLPATVMPLPANVLRIGRADDNDVVVPDMCVSRYHAVLGRSPGGGFEIIDLGSHNGTFLNGQRTAKAAVTEADVAGAGPASFRLAGDELQEFIWHGTAADLRLLPGCPLHGGRRVRGQGQLGCGLRRSGVSLMPPGAGRRDHGTASASASAISSRSARPRASSSCRALAIAAACSLATSASISARALAASACDLCLPW